MPLIYDELSHKATFIYRFLHERLATVALPPNLYVVIGGDGYMLQCVRNYYAPEHIFLGLNCGRLGFLLNELPEELETLPERLLSPSLRITTFPRIRMQARDVAGNCHEALALNDIYLERMSGQTCHLKLQIDGTVVVHELVCDGMIFSTALGSTAYTFSAGGVPCHPSLQVIGITPICPHVPRMTPLVFPLSSTVEACVLSIERRRVRAVVDGVDFNEISHLSVSDAKSPVRLAFFQEHDFTGTLVRKVLHV